MNHKLAIQFSIPPVYEEPYMYLKLCLHCHGHSPLPSSDCIHCGAPSSMVPLTEYHRLLLQKQQQGNRFLWIAAVLILLTMTPDVYSLIAVAVLGVFSVLILRYLQSCVFHKNYQKVLQQYLLQQKSKIGQELNLILEKMDQKMRIKEYVPAYEALLYIGKVMDSVRLRKMKLACLNTFYLRSDMELEVDSILLSEFDETLCDYLYAVYLLKKENITEKAIAYMIHHEKSVLRLPNGYVMMGAMAECALRTRRLFGVFEQLVTTYIEELSPKARGRYERFIQEGGPTWEAI